MPLSAALSDSCAAKWLRYKVGRAGGARRKRSDVGRLSRQAGIR
jgi:hypothetical protein